MSNRFRVAFRETLCSPGRGCCWFLKSPKCQAEHISSYRNSNSQNSSDKPPFSICHNSFDVSLKDYGQVNRTVLGNGSRVRTNEPNTISETRHNLEQLDSMWRFLPRLKGKRKTRGNKSRRKNLAHHDFEIVKCEGKVIPDLSFICLECSLDLRKIESCPYCSEYSGMNLDSHFLYYGKGASLSTGDLIDEGTSGVDHYQISESAV